MHRWISSAIIYQVNLRSFAAREPRNPVEAAQEEVDARSPLVYLADNLSTLKALGVNVLHLMPPFPIGVEGRKGIGSPYAVRDYAAINPEFGTMEDLRVLVREAHAAGFKVILGFVPNHTSCDHVWVSAHPEYYVKDEQGGIAHDLDWTDTAKLDYCAPGLRQAMLDTCDSWVSCLGTTGDGPADGVDGFRFDMAHFINDLSFWNEALPELRRRHPDRELLFLAECYGRDNNLDLFERGINAAYDDEFYKACEHFYGLDESGTSQLVPVARAGDHKHLAERRKLFAAEGIAGVISNALSVYETGFPAQVDAPRLARYTDNHDEGRGVYRYGDGAVRAVNRLLFCAPHTIPFLLSGQEFGALNRPSIHDRIRTCEKGRRVRDGRKVRWQEGIEFEGNLFARGAEARAEWYRLYQELIRLRQNTPELREGDFRLLDVGERGRRGARSVVAFERALDGRRVRCAVNLGPEAKELRQADVLSGAPLYGRLDEGRLGPFEAVVVRPA